jgi:hypothetical protein
MQKQFLFGMLVMIAALRTEAQRFDYQWPFGYGSNLSQGYGLSLLDFNGDSVKTIPWAAPGIRFGNGAAFICDEAGEVMLLTNNCAVYDRNFQIIEGGEMPTPGTTYQNFCPDFHDYPADQSTLFLPALDNDSVTYLLHKDSELSSALQDVVTRRFYLSTIVRRPSGAFYLKEKRLLLEVDMVVNRLTATRHADGLHWWTWAAGYNTNTFYVFRIGGPEGVEGPLVQEIGPDLLGTQVGVGQTAFSPTGNILGMNNKFYGALLYDFDRNTGVLSNWRSHLYPNPTNETAEGLAFSPNGRFLYLTAGRDLYQMDIEDPDPTGSTVYIAQVSEPDENGWPIGMGSMYPGPDCRIYIGPGTTTFYIHAIHRPNEKGPDCRFHPKALRAPTRLKFDFPNFPVFRLNGECDPTIGLGMVAALEPAAGVGPGLRLFPNPASERLFFESSEPVETLEIFDLQGNLVAVGTEKTQDINIAALPPGVYTVVARCGRGVCREMLVKK